MINNDSKQQFKLFSSFLRSTLNLNLRYTYLQLSGKLECLQLANLNFTKITAPEFFFLQNIINIEVDVKLEVGKKRASRSKSRFIKKSERTMTHKKRTAVLF
uniref:(northern house mosquito) hypothetical protein n=1 Tax=Culex pipiens TaxID=7175 RepID=A0A8D7ZTQ0_CULPI